MKRLIYVLVALALITSAAALPFFTDRMNFPPGESRLHTQTIDFDGMIRVTIPQGFNVTSATSNATISPGNLTFQNTTEQVEFNMTSPNNCTEPQIFRSQMFVDDAFSGEFRFQCIPDDKVVDFKVEYGHGEGNYLDSNELFIPTDQATLFNLVRVYPLGHVLLPNRAIENATLDCIYPDRTVRTFGRVELGHDFANQRINGTFFWSKINSGYWFRVGVVSQDTHDYNVGDTFNVSCNSMTYSLGTHQVQAPFTNYSLRFVSKTPFIYNAFNDTQTAQSTILQVTNNESYIAREVEFVFRLNNDTTNVMIPEMRPGESFYFRLNIDRDFNVSAFFVPPWFHNSFEDDIYVQQDSELIVGNLPPLLGAINDQSVFINESCSATINGTDPNGDVFTFSDNTTLFDINATTGFFNATNNGSNLGNNSILITLTDEHGLTDQASFICEFLNITRPPSPNATPSSNITTGGGGGGGGSPGPYPGLIRSGGGGRPICRERWICGNWTPCINGTRTRQCEDLNECGTIYDRPSSRRECIPDGFLVVNISFDPTCYDGIQNQGETGIDCGGPCPACAQLEMPTPSCGDQYCLYSELFACDEDCAIPSLLLLMLLYGLFFIPIVYFEYLHYKGTHARIHTMSATIALYVLIVALSYNAITSVRQLSIIFWGIIAALILGIVYLFEHDKR